MRSVQPTGCDLASADTVTGFRLATPDEVLAGLLRAVPRVLTDSRARELAKECDNPSTLALVCADGLLIVRLQPNPAADALELFVLAAVADRHGAFARQDAAVLELARDLQASTVAFRAARRGWGRVLGPEWAPRGTDEFVRIVHGRRKRQGNPGAESTG